MVLPTQIEQRLAQLGLSASEVEERFIRGRGPGGQKINKTSSTVVLQHRALGIEVRCQAERSQAANRERAWRELCDRVERQRTSQASARRDAREKERRRKRPKTPAQKRRMVEEKRRRARLKSARGRVGDS